MRRLASPGFRSDSTVGEVEVRASFKGVAQGYEIVQIPVTSTVSVFDFNAYRGVGI